MTYSDFAARVRGQSRPGTFTLHLPRDASEARRIAQRKYEDAISALALSKDEAHIAALAEVERARRNYGAILLREDKQRRPHIYAK